jgi:hypothetical protein
MIVGLAMSGEWKAAIQESRTASINDFLTRERTVGRSILETKDKLVGPGVVELAADHLFDVFPVGAQSFQDFFLFAQAGFGLGESLLALRFELAEAIVLRPRLPEENPRRQAEAEKQHKIKADDDATHGDVEDRRRSTAPARHE